MAFQVHNVTFHRRYRLTGECDLLQARWQRPDGSIGGYEEDVYGLDDSSIDELQESWAKTLSGGDELVLFA